VSSLRFGRPSIFLVTQELRPAPFMGQITLAVQSAQGGGLSSLSMQIRGNLTEDIEIDLTV